MPLSILRWFEFTIELYNHITTHTHCKGCCLIKDPSPLVLNNSELAGVEDTRRQ